MKLSNEGLEFIKKWEGLYLKAYKALSTEKYYTIGYGHYGSDVKSNQEITKEEAEKLLIKDLEACETHVNSYMSAYNFTQNEYDALVSFTFNVGSLNQLTNNKQRSKATIADKMLLYNKSGGKYIQGLQNRRNAEHDMFVKNVKCPADIVDEVIRGKWGNGEERRIRLSAAGYDYATVQAEVNRRLKNDK